MSELCEGSATRSVGAIGALGKLDADLPSEKGTVRDGAMEPELLAAGTRRGMGECSVVIGPGVETEIDALNAF